MCIRLKVKEETEEEKVSALNVTKGFIQYVT